MAVIGDPAANKLLHITTIVLPKLVIDHQMAWVYEDMDLPWQYMRGYKQCIGKQKP